MNVTHHLRFHLRDNDTCEGECLCTKQHALVILFSLLRQHEEQRFFISLRDLFSGHEEELTSFCRDGSCYYYDEYPEQPGEWKVHSANDEGAEWGVCDQCGAFVPCRNEREAKKLAMLFNIQKVPGKSGELKEIAEQMLGHSLE